MLLISENVQSQSQQTVKNPALTLLIDGVPYRYGSSTIKQKIRIGDPDLYIDGSWFIGDLKPLEGQRTFISLQGSSTSIKQQIDMDKGRGSSIQSMDIELIDVRGEVTELITPGAVVDDILGRKAKVYLTLDYETASWPEDYVILFRGMIDDIKAAPASVAFTISHPEQKKKQAIFTKTETTLPAGINDAVTSITVDSTLGFLTKVQGPDGSYDPSFKSYIRIDDELIQYTGISGNTFTGCTRGQLFTTPVAHAADADVVSFYRISGTAMDLALKIMLSGGGYFVDDLEVSSVNIVSGVGTVPDTYFFSGLDIVKEYGLTVGDFVEVNGSVHIENDIALTEITAIEVVDGGSYIEVSGAGLVDESTAAGTIKFRSKYDTLPNGLALGADEVDVEQHEYLKSQFLSSFNYDFYLKDTIDNGREWLDAEVYKPASAYSVPRKTQASAAMLVGPIPGARITTFDQSNIVKPSEIKLRRSLGKNFYNTIIYKYEEDELEDKFLRSRVEISATSLNQIPVGNRALVIESKGLRVADLGATLAQSASQRRLKRYEFGAEYFEGVKVHLGAGFEVEVGDIVIFDPTDLNVANTVDGDRYKPAALFEVQNKTLNYKTGEVTVDILDTAFDESSRYGLIGPASRVRAGISGTSFVIEESFNSPYGTSEFQKWKRYRNPAVIVRSVDSVTRYGSAVIQTSDSNTITLQTSLGFTPQAGDIMELADYADQTDQVRLVYGYMGDPLSNGDDDYRML
jgi:signal peptidase I